MFQILIRQRSKLVNSRLQYCRHLSSAGRVILSKVAIDAKDCLEYPNELVNFSTLVDSTKLLSDVYSSESLTDNDTVELFDLSHKNALKALQVLDDNRVLIQERSALMTLQDETRQETNSEVLSLAGVCFFGVFSVAIHPIFLVPFAAALRSLSKQRKRESYRVEGMDRMVEINQLTVQNSKEALNLVENISLDLKKLTDKYPIQ